MTVGSNVTSAVSRINTKTPQLVGQVKKNSGSAGKRLEAASKKLGKSERHSKFKLFKIPFLGGFFGPLLAFVILAALVESLED